MLLNNNSDKVISLLNYFEALNNIDKIRLTDYIINNKGFNYDTSNIKK